jgi:hypothetical protein
MAECFRYDIGNSGDMLKHGFLVEFVHSWHDHCSDLLVFLDPFSGVPSRRPVKRVISRLQRLKGTALARVQSAVPEEYCGSSLLMREAGKEFDVKVDVFVSDRDRSHLEKLIAAGFQAIEIEDFDKTNGYSIFDTQISGHLLLIDPFHHFIPDEAEGVIPKLPSFSNRMTIVLFVLNLKPHNKQGQRYRQLINQHCSGGWLAKCPPLVGSNVKGESGYHVELLIVPSTTLSENMKSELFSTFEAYCQKLGPVIGAKICLEIIKGEAVLAGSYCRGCGRYFPATKHPKDHCSCGPIGRNRRKFCEFCGDSVNPANPTYCRYCKQAAGKP